MVLDAMKFGVVGCFIFGWIILLHSTGAVAKSGTVIVNPEITDLYAKSDQQIERYLKDLEEMDQRFKQVLLGKGYVTKVFSTTVETIYEQFQRNRAYVIEAQKKHRANAKQMGKEDRWIDKMRGWADYNTRQAIRYTWLAKMDLVKAEVARVFTQARDFSQRQAKTLREQEDKLEAKYGYDYKKIEQNMEKVYSLVAEKEINEVQKIFQQYQEVGKDFVQYRKKLAEDTWRWYHYLFDGNFEDRANEYKKLVYKSFAYDLGERPKSFLIDLYGSTSFADSDMDFFMNMPGTEDRMSMYIHAAKDLDVFYKLNSFVASRPVELYDKSDFLAPLPVTGSIIERVAKTLSARQKSYYKTSQEIERVVAQMKPVITNAESLVELIRKSNNLSLELNRFVRDTQSLESLAKDTEDAKRDLEILEDQLSKTHSRLISKRMDLENSQKYQSLLVVLDYRTNQYRLANQGESGKDKRDILKRFDLRIKLLDDQLRNMENQTSEIKDRIFQRKAVLIQERQQLVSIVNPDDVKAKEMIAELEKKQRQQEKAVDAAQRVLANLDKNRASGSAQVINKTFDDLGLKYAKFYDDLLASKKEPLGSMAVLAKQTLTKPIDIAVRNDVIAQVEILAGYQRGLERLQPLVREKSDEMQQKVNRQLANLKRLDKRLSLYAQAVTRHKAQAASVIIFVAQQAGANTSDPLVQFMRSLREAAKETQKYLVPTEIAYEKMKVSDEEKQLLNTGNTIITYFASDTIKALKLDKINDKIDVAKRASALVENYASKGMVIGSTISALRNNEEPNLSNSLSYFSSIAEIGKMAADGAPVFGDLFGAYMDFMAYAVTSIRTQALSIQDRVFANTEKYLVSVKPEDHLYTKSEIKSEMPTINFSDRERVLRIYQIRRVVALMQAQSYKDVCDRPVGNKNRCN